MANATEKAFDQIRRWILDGRFKPGDHLKEQELVDLCGVSRTPVRDALRLLIVDGYVINRPNMGTYVNSWTRDDLNDIFELRARLEGYTARRAATRWADHHMDALEAAYHAICNSFETGIADVATYLAENSRFHSTLMDAADSDPLRKQVTILIQPPVVARTAMGYSLEDLIRSNEHHRELLDALSARDGDWAEAIMASHIRSAKQKFFREYKDGL